MNVCQSCFISHVIEWQPVQDVPCPDSITLNRPRVPRDSGLHNWLVEWISNK